MPPVVLMPTATIAVEVGNIATTRKSRVANPFTEVVKNSGPFQGEDTSCDEYPFASTAEGGTGATRFCVAAWQNSLQGALLRWSGLTPGQQFVVRVSGVNCSSVTASDLQGCGGVTKRKRQSNGNGNGIPTSGFGGTIFPFAFPSFCCSVEARLCSVNANCS